MEIVVSPAHNASTSVAALQRRTERWLQAAVRALVGTIKRAMGHDYFLMKGLNKVGAEMSLTFLSYNLKRVMNLIGVKKMIDSVA